MFLKGLGNISPGCLSAQRHGREILGANPSQLSVKTFPRRSIASRRGILEPGDYQEREKLGSVFEDLSKGE